MSASTVPLHAVKAISNAVAALTLAHDLGAPRDALDEALGRVSVTLGVPLTQRVKETPEPTFHAPEPDEERESAWDPEPVEVQIEATRCRALLLTVVQRAMHDWVMYRTHSKKVLRELAEEAYIWLFEEKPGHPWWREREYNGHTITAFLAICELMEVDPDIIRHRAKRLTPHEIMNAGRPAERRRRPSEQSSYVEHASQVDIHSLDDGPNNYYGGSYEAQLSVTPGYL